MKITEQLDNKVRFKLFGERTKVQCANTLVTKDFLDLSVALAVVIDENNILTISEKMCEEFDLDTEQLFSCAYENNKKLLDKTEDLSYKIDTLMGRKHEDSGDLDKHVYVKTTVDALFGGSALLYTDWMLELANKENSDLYLIPSSIHEIIIIPVTQCDDVQDLLATINDVNTDLVEDDDVLSNSLYRYSRANNCVAIAGEGLS